MKLSGRRIETFVRAPDSNVRAVLVYGPNRGLVADRAGALAKSVVDDLRDPFRVADITAVALRADPARLADEAAAQALTGGRRVVRLHDAGDDAAVVLAAFLDAPVGDSLVVVDAGDLRPGALRRLFEKHDIAAALPCYEDDGESLPAVARAVLSELGVEIERDALALLAEQLSADRRMARTEVEKLALYVGPERRITADDVADSVGDNAVATMDMLADAVGGGDHATASRAWRRLAMDGVGPVPCLRTIGRHLQRLHLVKGQVVDGVALDRAVAALKPRPHFKRAPAFQRQARRWPVKDLVTAMDMVLDAEAQCKRTGMPATLIAGLALMRITEASRRHQNEIV